MKGQKVLAGMKNSRKREKLSLRTSKDDHWSMNRKYGF
jgi:hypothetical protein